MTAGHVLPSECGFASNYVQRESAASSRERLPRNHSQTSTEVISELIDLCLLLRRAHSSPVSGTDKWMEGGEKKGVWILPLVRLKLYQTVSYLFLEPQRSSGEHDHILQLE